MRSNIELEERNSLCGQAVGEEAEQAGVGR